MFCKKCGFENPDDSLFCSSCGEKLDGVLNNHKRKTKLNKKVLYFVALIIVVAGSLFSFKTEISVAWQDFNRQPLVPSVIPKTVFDFGNLNPKWKMSEEEFLNQTGAVLEEDKWGRRYLINGQNQKYCSMPLYGNIAFSFNDDKLTSITFYLYDVSIKALDEDLYDRLHDKRVSLSERLMWARIAGDKIKPFQKRARETWVKLIDELTKIYGSPYKVTNIDPKKIYTNNINAHFRLSKDTGLEILYTDVYDYQSIRVHMWFRGV